MWIELILSFISMVFIYALDEVFLIEQIWKERLRLYPSWTWHFRINPLIAGIPIGLISHSILLGIISYLMFAVFEDWLYNLISHLKGSKTQQSDYLKGRKIGNWFMPDYYFYNILISIVLIWMVVR